MFLDYFLLSNINAMRAIIKLPNISINIKVSLIDTLYSFSEGYGHEGFYTIGTTYLLEK